MSNSPITLDRSDWGYVIVCAEHPYWSAFRFLKEDAQACAIRHEATMHPGDERQRNAAGHRRRHAERRAEIATTV